LTKFDISKNVFRAEGGKTLAAALSSNQVMIELNISDNLLAIDEDGELDMSGIVALAGVIPGMGALSKLDASDNSLFGMKDKAGIIAWADALKANTSITELNLAKSGINANDAKILALAISDNGALTSLNLSSNDLEAQGAKSFAEVIKVTVLLRSFWHCFHAHLVTC
jgi:Ran GTPase-activating protein (RanGAP) involved in mRNA processing and transport